MPVYIYDGHEFPPPANAETDPNGLLAISISLTAQDVLKAYRTGIFPWSSPGDPILWWSPDPRMVLFPWEIRVTRSLKKNIRNANYEIRLDTAFEDVMRACAAPRRKDAGTWITEAYIKAYTDLFKAGFAHSVEIWVDNQLKGGLYGVSIGRMFYGESMFSFQRDTSKIAFAFLTYFLAKNGYSIIDCQLENPHLTSLGAREIPRDMFLTLLQIQTLYPNNVLWQATPEITQTFRALEWLPVLQTAKTLQDFSLGANK